MRHRGQTASNHYGAINVSGGTVNGIDIPSRQYRMTETHSFYAAQINQAYLDCFMALTGTVNQYYFRNKPAGDILFLGGSGSYRGDNKVEITYQFSYSPTAYNIVAGDILIPVKRGWDYPLVRVYRYRGHRVKNNGQAASPRTP